MAVAIQLLDLELQASELRLSRPLIEVLLKDVFVDFEVEVVPNLLGTLYEKLADAQLLAIPHIFQLHGHIPAVRSIPQLLLMPLDDVFLPLHPNLDRV